jgi:hypothetical protein
MIPFLKTLFALSSMALLMACGSRQPRNTATETSSTESSAEQHPEVAADTNAVVVWTRDQAAKGPETFKLVVSFISIGQGTDPEAAGLLATALAEFRSAKGKSPAYIMIPWGREGEVDYCFIMNELAPAEQREFIGFMKQKLGARTLIQIQENGRNRFR